MQTKQCEHCGRPVSIPDGVDEAKLKKAVEDAINGQMGDFCSRFPSLCGQVSSLEKKVNVIQEATTGHPLPSENLLNIWGSCTECRPLAERLGLIKPLEEKEPEECSFPWIPKEA